MTEPLEDLDILEKEVEEPYTLQAKKSVYKLKPKDPNAPKRPKTEAQKEAWSKAIAKRTENREARKNVKDIADIEFKKELDEKIVKKAIAIKKKQITKAKIFSITESDEEEIQKPYVSKPRVVKVPVVPVFPVIPVKKTYNFL